MPAPPLNQTLSLTGADAVKAQLADVGSSGSASLATLAQGAAALGGSFEGLTATLTAMAPAFAALFGAASLSGLYDLASSAAEATHQLENLAQIAGTSSESIQGFQYALASVGVSSDTGSTAMAKMLAVLGKADEAFQKVADSATNSANAQQVASEKSDLAVRSAELSANSAYNAAVQSADAITKAQVSADKAALSYEALRTKLAGATGTVQQMRDNAIRLADSQAQVTVATDGIAAAQNRAVQTSAQWGLAQQREKIASDERSAAMDKFATATDKGITKFQEWLKDIGVAGADMTELSTDGTEAFYKILDGLQNLSNTEQALYAKQIWSRGWKEMIPAINAGGAALKKFSDDFATFGYELDDNDKKLAGGFLIASRQLGAFADAIKLLLGDRLTAAFTPPLQAIDDWLKNNGKTVNEFIDGFVAAIGDAGTAVSVFFGLISTVAGPILKELYAELQEVVDVFNKTFGTNLTAAEVIFDGVFLLMGSSVLKFIDKFVGVGAAFLKLGPILTDVAGKAILFAAAGVDATVAWSAFLVPIALIAGIIALLVYNFENWDTQVKGWTDAWNGFWILLIAMAQVWARGMGDAVSGVQNVWQGFKDYLQSWADWFRGIGDSIIQAFKDAWNGAISFVENLWNELIDWIQGAALKILAFFQPVLDMLKSIGQLLGLVSSADAGSATGSVGMASGGQVAGSGSGDTVHAVLTPGEFVVRQPVVQQLGVGFFHAINSGHASLMAMGGAVRMALGGLVPQPQRFATGGAVAAAGAGMGGMAAVHLHLGGSTFSLLGEKGVVGALTGAARKASISTTGTAPSWKR